MQGELNLFDEWRRPQGALAALPAWCPAPSGGFQAWLVDMRISVLVEAALTWLAVSDSPAAARWLFLNHRPYLCNSIKLRYKTASCVSDEASGTSLRSE